jgi:hypothetical protein
MPHPDAETVAAVQALGHAVVRLARKDIVSGPWRGEREYGLLACGEVTRAAGDREPCASDNIYLSEDELSALRVLHAYSGTGSYPGNAYCLLLNFRLDPHLVLSASNICMTFERCLMVDFVGMDVLWRQRGVFTAVLDALEAWLHCVKCPFNALAVSSIAPQVLPSVARRAGWFRPGDPDDPDVRAVISDRRPFLV